MAIPTIDPNTVIWPAPWLPMTDDTWSLEFGRWTNPKVAKTVLDELHREICKDHPLYEVECIPLAYDSRIKKDFLFATDQLDMPFVLVHFTWTVESNPNWPFVIPFQSIEEFFEWLLLEDTSND